MSSQPSNPVIRDLQSTDTRHGLCGLAELAFGSLTRTDEPAAGQHLALLRAESLELDLSDPAQRRFGDYELLELLGEGGMGAVYRARHAPLDREVAVKLLSAGPWASKDFIARFEREAQNAARMQHPNIVTVYEAGSHEGLHFFSMRLVEGHSLSELLKRGEHYTFRQAASLACTMAEAVAYAHSLGVLHLDLKPGNVLIDRQGVPHVADFGLARRLDSALSTVNDEVSGTPAYMAPEQAQVQSSRLTAATDVWGLGAILYELLTGKPPFKAESAQATLKLVLEGQVRSPRRLQPHVPLDLQAIVLKCLARDPHERYPSARALADDLARFVEGRPVQARPLNVAQRAWRWARREPRLAATAVAAVGVLVIGLAATSQQWYRADRNAGIARANAATANARLWDSRNDAAQRFMEEGQDWQAAPLLLANLKEMQAAGDADHARGARLRLGLVRNGNPALIDAIPAQKPAVAIAFDASGKRMATSGTETGLLLFDTADGRQLLRVPGRPHEVWSRLRFTPGGRVLLAQRLERSAQSPRPAQAYMRRLDTLSGSWLAPPAPFADADAQSYSADGRYAVLTLPDGHAQFWETSPWHALSPLRRLPFPDGEQARLIAPDGSFFALNGPEGAVTLVDSRSLAVTRIPLGEFGRIATWAMSPDSRWLALGDAAGHAVVVEVATRGMRRLEPRPSFGARWLAFSDDGGWLALAAREGGVYLWSWPEGRLLVPPFSASATTGGAPLAEHVELDRARGQVFVTDETANTALWQVAPAAHATDQGLARRVMAGVDTRMDWGVEAAAWHPATGLIASAVDERVRLARLRAPVLKTGRAAPLRAGSLRFDGRHLVEVDGRRVRVVDAMTELPLGDPIEFVQPPTFAELTPDGATLVVGSGSEMHVLDSATGKARFAPIVLDGAPTHVDLSPDGQRIALAWLTGDVRGGRTVSEMVVIHSLADGRRLGGPEPLPGPTNEVLAFSPDGSRLLVWNPRELALRDGVTMAPVAGPLAHFLPRGRDEDSHHGLLRAVAFDASGGVELVHVRHDGSRWLPELRRYAPGGAPAVTPLQRGWPLALLPLPNGRGTVVASGDDPLNRIVGRDGVSRGLPDMGDDARRAALALSPDGRWLVRTRLDGVVLFDLDRFTRVATLSVALPQPDEVLQLAFSPDGHRLLGRSVRNRYLVWDLAPDGRPVEAIARELGLRDLPFNVARHGADTREPDPAERRALHAADPGAPPAPPVPVEPAAARMLPGGAIPPRDPAAPADLLDLTPYYTLGPGESSTGIPGAGGDFTWLSPGVQRFLGVDYDVRGGVRLTGAAPLRFEPGNRESARTVRALDVLALLGAGDPGHLALLRWDYADHTHADVPLALDEHFGDYWRAAGTDPPARLAAFGWDARLLRDDDRRAYVFTLRVPNPHPERPVKTLTLSNPNGSGSAPVVLALTLEPVRRTAAGRAAQQGGY